MDIVEIVIIAAFLIIGMGVGILLRKKRDKE